MYHRTTILLTLSQRSNPPQTPLSSNNYSPPSRPPQSTGVSVTDEVIEAFNNFKLKRDPHKCRFFTYKMSDDKKNIELDSTGDLDKSYEDFCEALPEDDCRYGLIDLEFQVRVGGWGLRGGGGKGGSDRERFIESSTRTPR